MTRRNTTAGFAYLGSYFLLLASVVVPTTLIASGKDHPMQGTVTALGTSQETTGGGTTSVFTFEHRTYTVKTDNRIFVLECPYYMSGGIRIGPTECGGKRKIALGDTIHFRLEKNKAFILNDQGKDQKLRIIREELNTGGNSGAPSQQP
jgi:hypothetical protein